MTRSPVIGNEPHEAGPAIIVPFPLARRAAFVRKQAVHLASLSPQARESCLREVLRVQRGVMTRRGVDDAVIEREIDSLRLAIGADLGRLLGWRRHQP